MNRRILFLVSAIAVVFLAYFIWKNWSVAHANDGNSVQLLHDPSDSNSKVVVDKADLEHLRAEAEAPRQAPTPKPAYTTTTTQPTMPTTDSIDPNPPNGMVFSGTGRYQLYRQGNITWRLDTDNGHACIIFATDEEWRKQRVLNRGCGNT